MSRIREEHRIGNSNGSRGRVNSEGMFRYLLLAFLIIPLVELALLVWLVGVIDFLPTIGLVVITGVLGATLTRHQGIRTLARFRESLAEGRLPHREMMDGILILMAGAVLITPGVLTDAAGFLLLVPPVRRKVVQWLSRRLQGRVVAVGPGHGATPRGDGGGDIIDAEFTVHED